MSKKFLIAYARFNELATQQLLVGARAAFTKHQVASDAVDEISVAGSFELPVIASEAAKTGKYQAIVCIGCIIRGETPHFDIVANESARGLMSAMLTTGVPIANGILTCDNTEQALARCGLKSGNKGAEAVETVLDTVNALARLREGMRK